MVAGDMKFKKSVYGEPVCGQGSFFLVGNIGGTNARFALAQVRDSGFSLIALFQGDSKQISRFHLAVDQILSTIKNDYDIVVSQACFAVAGLVSQGRDYCRMTNLSWDIDTKLLIEQTSLVSVVLLNDFEAVGYGIEGLSEYELQSLTPTKKTFGIANKAIIGAGTGLGKSVLIWNELQKEYVVVATEGGSADFPAYDSEELALISFIRRSQVGSQDVCFEHLLSGRGIQNIYKFLCEEKKVASSCEKKIRESNCDPKVIAACQADDLCCKKTFEYFVTFYGRCARNFALETLALGGVYIAGGIALSNLDLFRSGSFLSEFYRNQTFRSMLQNIPVSIITSPHVELYGAILFGRRAIL